MPWETQQTLTVYVNTDCTSMSPFELTSFPSCGTQGLSVCYYFIMIGNILFTIGVIYKLSTNPHKKKMTKNDKKHLFILYCLVLSYKSVLL